MEKGDKVIYNLSAPNLGFEIGFYLFPLNSMQDPLHRHLVTSDASLVDKIVDYETFATMHMSNGILQGAVKYLPDGNVLPHSKALENRQRKLLSFALSRLDGYKLFFPNDWTYFRNFELFRLSFPKLLFDYYIAKLSFFSRRFINHYIFPIFAMFLFDFYLIFNLYGEYRQTSNDFRRQEKSRERRSYYELTMSTENAEREKAELQLLKEKKEAARENLLKSSRALLGFGLAVATLLGSQFLFKKSRNYV